MRIMALVAVMLLAWVSPLAAGENETLSVKLVPVREKYHVGEPVLFVAELQIGSKDEIQVDANARLPLMFVAADEKQRRVLPPMRYGVETIDYIVAMEKLAVERVYREVMVVNPSVVLDKPGRYLIPYHVELYGARGEKYSSKRQELEVVMEAGPVDAAWIGEMVGKFRKSMDSGKELERDLAKDQGRYRLDDMGSMQWGAVLLGVEGAGCEAVDEVLVESMNRVRGLGYELCVIDRVGGKLKGDAKLREMFLRSVKGAQGAGVYAALMTMRDEKLELPEAWMKEVFASNNYGGKRALIEHLRAYGSGRDIQALERVAGGKNKEEGAKAAKAIEEIKNREKK